MLENQNKPVNQTLALAQSDNDSANQPLSTAKSMDFSSNSRDRPLTMDRASETNMASSLDRGSGKLGFNGTDTHTDLNSRDSS